MAEIDAVYRLAYRLSPRPDQADDLVQETYLRAFKYGTHVTVTEHGLRPYLFKILHNVLNTRLARDLRQPAGVEDLSPHASPDAETEQASVDLAHLDWDTIDERLKHAIDQLPLTHRTVFLLCAVERLRYREIAEIVQVPIGTVMSRLHRARHLLASQLGELAAERGMESGKNTGEVDRNAPSEG